MSDKNKKTRGRPRAFDESAVVASAARVFLEQGYEAVTYEHLAKEVGLSKPSLYNTFGDKSALFDRVLEDYSQKALAFAIPPFKGKTSLQDAVGAFLQGAAELYSRTDELSRGCLLIGTALPACTFQGGARQTLTGFIQSLETALQSVIEVEYANDAQALKRSPQALSLLISSLLFSLAIRARTGMTRSELSEKAENLTETFPCPANG